MASIHSTISFGLVNIPVLLHPVVKNNDISFHQLHKKCFHRVMYVKYCPHCKMDLKMSDIIKGYQYEKGEYIEFTSKELQELKPENEGEIEIISFVPMKEIDPSYFEKSYCLTSEKKTKAYSLFVKALEKTNLVGLCKTVLHNKFYYAILRFYENNIILSTLYFETEMNMETSKTSEKVNTKELDLAVQLIHQLKGHFEPEKYKDEYQEKIEDAIDDKLAGRKMKKVSKTRKTEVKDLMKALEKSLKK